MNFNRLTIEGTDRNPKRTILEGKSAKGRLGAAQNGIEAISVDGLVLKNLWARNYRSNGFFIHAAPEGGQPCDGYTMNNLLASANRSYGLFAKKCLGGKMVNSAGYHQGDSAFSVSETPCDSKRWNVYGTKPCQRKPEWTLLKNDAGYENVLGYSGTNSKYVRIVDSAFYSNGTGIAPNTLDSEGYEPNGWLVIERNDVFWNNYNYFLEKSAFHTALRGPRRSRRRDRQLPHRGRDHPLRLRPQRRPQEPRFRQLQVGHRLVLRSRRNLCRQRGRRSQERRQRNRRKHDGPRRRRPQRRIRHVERQHRRRQLLGRQQPHRDLRAGQWQGRDRGDLPDLPAGRGRRTGASAASTSPPGCSSTSKEPTIRGRSSATRRPTRPEPAVHLGQADRPPPEVPGLQAGRSPGSPRRTRVLRRD